MKIIQFKYAITFKREKLFSMALIICKFKDITKTLFIFFVFDICVN